MKNKPTFVFLHGGAATGKLTIAKELEKLTGFSVFHNHLVVDLVLSLFPFGTPEFVKHREKIWFEMIEDALTIGNSLIFTFHPEKSVKDDFHIRLQQLVKKAGGSFVSIAITCEEEIVEERISSESRKNYQKLRSLEVYRELREFGAFDYPEIPSDLVIDSGNQSASVSAEKIHSLLSNPQ